MGIAPRLLNKTQTRLGLVLQAANADEQIAEDPVVGNAVEVAETGSSRPRKGAAYFGVLAEFITKPERLVSELREESRSVPDCSK